MEFHASLDYLHALGWELRPGAKFDLLQVGALLDSLGRPHHRFVSVHVAGTNGKGSVAALVESAARAAGWRTALYTSPHLERVTERIRLAGFEIAPERFAFHATRLRAAADRLLAGGVLSHPPSFFEALTALAFDAIAAAGTEIAVLETGLGGRLDATNVVASRLAVITPIGLDHQQYLGSTLAAIAAEKAGIIKPGARAAITALQAPEVEEVLRARCRLTGVPLWRVAREEVERLALPTPLRGRHQMENAACARLACEALSADFSIPLEAMRSGFARVEWPGRLERIRQQPDVYLDGAHNPMAAEALAGFLAALPPPVLIFGCMADKEAAAMAERLFPLARAVVLTAPDHPRAAAPAQLAAMAGALATRCEIAPGIREAWACALRLAGDTSPIVVTGSLYLVGEARALLHRPAPPASAPNPDPSLEQAS